MTMQILTIYVACALMLVAAVTDIAARTIPNTLCTVVALLALAMHAARGDGIAAAIAGACVFGVSYVLWRRGMVGGGDVKLLTASALLVPPGAVPDLILAISLAGGVLALAYLLLSRLVRRPAGPRPVLLLARVIRAERWRISRGGPLPYACAIAAGTFTVLLNG